MIFQRLPNLPCFRQQSTGNLVIGTADYTVATARMIRQFSVTSSSNVSFLNHKIDSYLRDFHPNSSTTGTPIMYSTKDSGTGGIVITLAPTPSATLAYQVDFIAPETGLSSSNTTTWVSNNAPEMLLYACLVEAFKFLKNPQMVQMYESYYMQALQPFVGEQMGRRRRDEYMDGVPRITIPSENP